MRLCAKGVETFRPVRVDLVNGYLARFIAPSVRSHANLGWLGNLELLSMLMTQTNRRRMLAEALAGTSRGKSRSVYLNLSLEFVGEVTVGNVEIGVRHILDRVRIVDRDGASRYGPCSACLRQSGGLGRRCLWPDSGSGEHRLIWTGQRAGLQPAGGRACRKTLGTTPKVYFR